MTTTIRILPYALSLIVLAGCDQKGQAQDEAQSPLSGPSAVASACRPFDAVWSWQDHSPDMAAPTIRAKVTPPLADIQVEENGQPFLTLALSTLREAMRGEFAFDGHFNSNYRFRGVTGGCLSNWSQVFKVGPPNGVAPPTPPAPEQTPAPVPTPGPRPTPRDIPSPPPDIPNPPPIPSPMVEVRSFCKTGQAGDFVGSQSRSFSFAPTSPGFARVEMVTIDEGHATEDQSYQTNEVLMVFLQGNGEFFIGSTQDIPASANQQSTSFPSMPVPALTGVRLESVSHSIHGFCFTLTVIW